MGELGGGGWMAVPHAAVPMFLMFMVLLGTAQLCSPDEGHIVLAVQYWARWTFGAKTTISMSSFKFH